MKKLLIVFALLFAALLPALIGIFHPGFFVTDDGSWMIIRLSAFYEALRQGQFPIRFLPRLNNGYGYPVVDFLYPLFLYVGSLLHAFHISFTVTIKLLFGISLLFSAIGSFFWLKKQFGIVASFAGALVYALFPYHIWDITKRGSLGEVIALAIVPFVFWQIDSGSILFGALGIGLLILSHNTLALLFLIMIACYSLVQKKARQLLFLLLFGFGLAAFFWIPALYDIRYTVFSKTIVSDYSQYFLSSNLYTLIGMLSFFVILFSLVVAIKKISPIVAFFLVATLLSISLTTVTSKPLWEFFHLTTYVQFPFRFLSITTLGVAFLASYSIANWRKKYSVFLAGIIMLLVYISSWQFFFPKTYTTYPDTFYSTNQDTTTVQNEYMPIWVKKPYISQLHVEVSANSVEHMGTVIDKGSSMSFTLQASKPTHVTLGKIFFPGWVVTVDNTPQKIQTNDYGFIVFAFPEGEHIVKAWFGETPVRLIADAISLVTLFGMMSWVVLQKKGKHA